MNSIIKACLFVFVLLCECLWLQGRKKTMFLFKQFSHFEAISLFFLIPKISVSIERHSIWEDSYIKGQLSVDTESRGKQLAGICPGATKCTNHQLVQGMSGNWMNIFYKNECIWLRKMHQIIRVLGLASLIPH